MCLTWYSPSDFSESSKLWPYLKIRRLVRATRQRAHCGQDGRDGLCREGLSEHRAIYDYTYGPTLHPGRLEAIKKMRIRPGTEVLEVGVGTGINLSLYPKTSRVTGIDLSSKMLKKAQQRIDEKG